MRKKTAKSGPTVLPGSGALKGAAAGPAVPAPGETAALEISLNEEAYRRLEEMIVTLELAPGSVVSEAILSERIGIGTTPIREALQRLSREYLIQILPRRGVIVTSIDVRQQLQVLETRRELDRLIARAAARRGTPDDRARFSEIARSMQRAVAAGDMHAFLRADGELNSALAAAAHNPIATRTVATLHSVSRRFWFFHRNDRRGGAAHTMRLHVAFAKALAGGSEDAVGDACDALIDDLMVFARSTVGAD